MCIDMYFINDTKKQVVSSKLLLGDFEEKQQLLCYLSLCNGDTIRIVSEHDTWVDNFKYNRLFCDYKEINLYSYSIPIGADLYKSTEFERLKYEVLR